MLTWLLLCALACTDSLTHIVAPNATSKQDSNAVPAPQTVGGCATYDIALKGTGGKVMRLQHSSCGPLIPTIIGAPHLDATTSTLTLMIAIHNGGRVKLSGPLEIMTQSDSATVSGGAAGSAVRFPTATVRSGDSVSIDGQHVKWSFDAALRSAAHDSSTRTTLGIGDTTQVRAVSMLIPPGAHAVRLVLHSVGRLVFTVPLHAPRGTPGTKLHQLESPANVLLRDRYFGDSAVRNVVLVEFKPAATAEDRQAAVDAIDGSVDGGVPLGVSGLYLIEFPTHGDASGAPLERALVRLKQLPYVKHAMAHYIRRISPAYLRPKDSAGVFDTWKLSPDSATSWNWAQEADAAPLAWGCSVGDTSTRVALVDSGFNKISDLTPNFSGDTSFQTGGKHGTYTSSVLAAVGDNGTGIAGLMWHAHLGLFYAFQPDTTISASFWPLLALQRAGDHGYKVINVSLEAAPSAATLLRVRNNTPTKTDSNNVYNWAEQVQTAIEHNLGAPDNDTALYVFAAGNDAIDAFWSGWPAAKYDTVAKGPSSVARYIIVATAYANGHPFTLWNVNSSLGADTGQFVDVAAPGKGVAALNASGKIDTVSGTSMAAPQVSGAAGDLLAFDSRLSADSLKLMILSGDTAGGRKASHYYTLNAYSALERAAKRVQAPLCGNHVYTDSNGLAIYADRADTFFIHRDSLGSFGGGSARVVSLHGGRTLYNDMGSGSIKYNGTAWQSDPNDTTFFTLSGQGEVVSSYNLSAGLNHDGDSVLTSGVDLQAHSDTIYIAAVGQSRQVLSVINTTGNIGSTAAVFSPVSRTVLAALVENANTGDIWTDIYSIPIANGLQTAKPIAHIDHAELNVIGYSEDGSGLWSSTYYPFRASDFNAIDYWNPASFGNLMNSPSPIEERSSSVNPMTAGISPDRVADRGRRMPNAVGRTRSSKPTQSGSP